MPKAEQLDQGNQRSPRVTNEQLAEILRRAGLPEQDIPAMIKDSPPFIIDRYIDTANHQAEPNPEG